MSKHRQILENNPLPQDFLDAIQEFLGSQISPNFQVAIVGGTTLRVPASTDNGQVAAAINGRWRYITANADCAAPGGLSTSLPNPIFLTAADNVFSTNPTPPPRELDSTNYAFALSVLPNGSVPGTALYRQVGTVGWTGAAFTTVTLSVFPAVPTGLSRGAVILLA